MSVWWVELHKGDFWLVTSLWEPSGECCEEYFISEKLGHVCRPFVLHEQFSTDSSRLPLVFSYACLPDLNIHFLCLCVLSFSSISGEEWPWPILLLLLRVLSLIVPEIQDSWGPWRPLRGGQSRISWLLEQKNSSPPWEGGGEPPHKSISYSWAFKVFQSVNLSEDDCCFCAPCGQMW